MTGLNRDDPISLLHEPLWERQYGESRPAWRAFVAYRDLGPYRSVVEAFRQTKRKPTAKQADGAWNGWADRWRWAARAEAWDAHVDATNRRAQEDVARREGERVADLRRAQRERELDLGDKLLRRAHEMLELPVIEVTTERDTEKGTVTQTIKPAKWRLADAATIARMGVELKRLGLDMETSRTTVRVDMEDELRKLARENGWDEDATIEAARRFAVERGDRTG